MSPLTVCTVLAASAAGALPSLILLMRVRSRTATALADLRGQARTDALTGLANRRTWEEELPRELARARRTAQPVSVVVADIDGFKAVNDADGHQAGDRLLTSSTAAWRHCLREVDLISRFGGDEFGFILPGCPESEALRVAERLRAAMPPGSSCSLGVAGWDGLEPAAGLFERADRALYAAKRGGRNRVVVAPDQTPTPERPLAAALVPAIS